MKNIKPCPECGGEVEMVKLIRKETDREDVFRIQCMKCRALVARGVGFAGETVAEAKERIADYEREIARLFNPAYRTLMLRADERKALQEKAKHTMTGPDDEQNDIHDASHTIFER